MLISDLIEYLQKLPQDVEVVVPTAIGTYIRPISYGLIRLIPVEPGSVHDKRRVFHLEPGNEWRMPLNSKDEPETKRMWGFILR